MLSQVSSLTSECKIPGGKVAFTLDKDKLTVKLSVIFEHCHCKLEKTLSSLKNTIPELEDDLQKDPFILYKKILAGKHIPESFIPFLKVLEPLSSKITQSTGRERRNSRSGKGFESPKKGETRKSRSESLPIQKNEAKTNSSPEILNNSKHGGTLESGKRPQKLNLPTEGSSQISPQEANQSNSSRTTQEGMQNSAGETSQPSPTRKKLTPKTNRKEIKNSDVENSSSPPDASQGSDSAKSSSSSSRDGQNSRRRPLESKKAIVIETSPTFKVFEGEGRFVLKSDQSFALKINIFFHSCLYKFKRVFSSIEKVSLGFQASFIQEPDLLFEKIVKNNIFSQNFHPFINPSFTLANDKLCEIYFKNGGKVPALPSNFIEIWNSVSELTGKKVCDSHTLFLVFEKDIISYGKAIENPKEKQYLMRLNFHDSPEDFNNSDLKIPYWVLITDEAIEGSSQKSFENQQKIFKFKNCEQYKHSNLIETGLYKAWKFVNNKPRDSKILIRCEETIGLGTSKEHLVMFTGNNDWDIEVKKGSDGGYHEWALGVWRFYPSDDKSSLNLKL